MASGPAKKRDRPFWTGQPPVLLGTVSKADEPTPVDLQRAKKGDCHGNAAMESWNHSFKVEAVHGERFKARSDAKYQVFEYIEVYYNRKRLHSTLGYLSPVAFEAKKVA